MKIPFLIIGILLILFGVYLWFSANYQAKVFDGIVSNTLVTTGVYAYVRNPIYSAFMLACTGAIRIANNCWLFVLPFFLLGIYDNFYEVDRRKMVI